jgi:DegV family protein with EDD domain
MAQGPKETTMTPVRLVTDSTADIPAEIAARLGISVVPCYVVFGTEAYRDGVELTKEQFYDRLSATSERPSTATPPPAAYEEVYRRLAQQGDEIVSIHLAANLSGLHNAASIAAGNVPEAQIAVVDSQQITMGYGWMVIAAAEAAQRGESPEHIIALVEGMKQRSRVLAVLDSLEFIHRSGRIGWAQAIVGTLMHIKPLVEARFGEVRLLERARTQSRAVRRLMDQVQALGKVERAIVLHANAPALAELVANLLQALDPGWERLIGQAGVTIASHAGPGAVAIACVTVE